MTDSEPSIKRLKQDVCEPETNYEEVANAALLKDANEALQRSNRIHVRPIVEESELGIELFVGDKNDEFHGLIKARYHDFIVHEVEPDGNVAQLTVLDAPEEQEPSSSTSLCDFVDSSALECISEVNNGYLNQYKIDVTGMDKDMRTSLHHAIRASFDRVESNYLCETEKKKAENGDANQNNKEDDNAKPDSTQQVDGDSNSKVSQSDEPTNGSESAGTAAAVGKKYIVVTRRNKISRRVNTWPRDRPDHTHFILYKEKKDTMDAIHTLAAAINAKPSNFSYAGVKDRRAVTTQVISSWRLEPKRLISACRRFNKPPFIKVGNFCFKKDQIKLGQLKANKFNIVIRHLVCNNEGKRVIDKAMNSIKNDGFVNYFGLQRFGTRSIQTHEIGLAVLQCKWEKAVDLILSYRFDDNMKPPIATQNKNQENSMATNDDDGSNSNIETPKSNFKQDNNQRRNNNAEQHNAFIDLWKLKLDADFVFKKYPHFRFTNEGLIMKYLSTSEENRQNYLNAITSLPRYTRSMYVHSYQSLIWNKITTYRLKKYGFKPIPGDLVLSPESNITDNSLDILLSADGADPKEESNNGKSAENDNAEESSNTDRKAPIEDISANIVVATAENLDKYSIFDIVLPIVGSRIKLPENDVGEELERLLKDDGLTLESFKARERLFISYGSYRKIMVKPREVSWQIKTYSHPYQNLIETDLDRLNRALSSKDNHEDDKPVSPPTSDSSDEALIVAFELPPSTYATMCLREIMKKPSTDFDNKF